MAPFSRLQAHMTMVDGCFALALEQASGVQFGFDPACSTMVTNTIVQRAPLVSLDATVPVSKDALDESICCILICTQGIGHLHSTPM